MSAPAREPVLVDSSPVARRPGSCMASQAARYRQAPVALPQPQGASSASGHSLPGWSACRTNGRTAARQRSQRHSSRSVSTYSQPWLLSLRSRARVPEDGAFVIDKSDKKLLSQREAAPAADPEPDCQSPCCAHQTTVRPHREHWLFQRLPPSTHRRCPPFP